MKLNTILLVAVIASSKALGAPNQVNVSGTVTMPKTTTTSNHQENTTTSTMPLKNSLVYGIVTNAVANVGTYSGSITPSALPSDGYIAWDPNIYDGAVSGGFYVTNKSGFYYPLSGVDVSSNYYSFVEFDTYNNNTNASIGYIDLGFSYNFNGVETAHYDTSKGTGNTTVNSTAVFYVHDNPYAFDYPDVPATFYTNNVALELSGIAKTTLNFKTNDLSSWSITFQGTGIYMTNGVNGVVNGHVSISSNNNVPH